MLKKLKFQGRPKMYYFDYFIFIPFFLLCIIGILMVYSASSVNLSYAGMSTTSYLKKQIIYVILGIIIVNIFARSFTLKRIMGSKIIVPVLWIAVILGLGYAVIFGKSINGAKGWISINGVFSIQPAEVAKLFFILYIARIFQNRITSINNTKWQFKKKDYVYILSILMFIFVTPDFGGLAINLAIIIVMLITVKAPKIMTVVKSVIGLGALLYLLFTGLKYIDNPFKGTFFEYAYRRFEGVVDPFGHVLTSGKQLVNSFYAISNGGIFGSGIGNGIQKRGYLPEPHTDFILSVLAEEMGAVGILIVLGLLLLLISRILYVGYNSRTLPEMLACYGISTFLTVESLFNIGAVVGFLPITGVTFPFVSYGGSSMVVLAATLGIAMSISNDVKYEKNHENQQDNNGTMKLIRK